MNLPDGKFANDVVLYTIVLNNCSISLFLDQNMEIETVCFKNPKHNLNNHYCSFVTLVSVQSMCM